jgi:hypothetical protein
VTLLDQPDWLSSVARALADAGAHVVDIQSRHAASPAIVTQRERSLQPDPMPVDPTTCQQPDEGIVGVSLAPAVAARRRGIQLLVNFDTTEQDPAVVLQVLEQRLAESDLSLRVLGTYWSVSVSDA